jgi:hypothetical protein
LRLDHELAVMVDEAVFAVLHYYQRFVLNSSDTNDGRSYAEEKQPDC